VPDLGQPMKAERQAERSAGSRVQWSILTMRISTTRKIPRFVQPDVLLFSSLKPMFIHAFTKHKIL